MALIECPECGHEVSDTAETCPNCGYRLKSQTNNLSSFNEETQQRIARAIKNRYITNILACSLMIACGVFLIIFGISFKDGFLTLPLCLMGGFVVLVSLPILIVVIKKTNPDTIGVNDVVKNNNKYLGVTGIAGGLFIIALSVILLALWSKSPAFDNKIIFSCVALMVTGLGLFVYGLYKNNR